MVSDSILQYLYEARFASYISTKATDEHRPNAEVDRSRQNWIEGSLATFPKPEMKEIGKNAK